MKKIEREHKVREEKVSDFELDAYIFWERVRALARMGLEETGGIPCGREGALFEILEGTCEAFEVRLREGIEGRMGLGEGVE